VQDIDLPDGVLLVAILRAGQALVARGHSEILPGDYVICLLPPDQERELLRVFLPDEEALRVQETSELDISEE
jgi:Trk K+ transport system NAD-binding subunit